ncbi:hypothetical protein LT337_32760 (plasmid) [Mycolicibacterium fortuitum]|nr:hypothetical protein LT337_32760 [Mycolicibacterium fortuitum]
MVRNGGGQVRLGAVATCLTDEARVELALLHGFNTRAERRGARLLSVSFDSGRHAGVEPTWRLAFDLSEHFATLARAAAKYSAVELDEGA